MSQTPRHFLLLILIVLFSYSVAQPAETSSSSPEQQFKESLLNDPELLNAMEIFMAMSGPEREETIQELLKAVGDDPKQRAEMEALIQMLPQLDDDSTLRELIQQDEIAKAKQQAAQHLQQETWESFWDKQEEILEAVLASGQLTPQDAARFKTDPDAWKAQLQLMYKDLTNNNNNKDEL